MTFGDLKATLNPTGKTIPWNMCPSRFFCFHFSGWKSIEFTAQNKELSAAFKVDNASVQALYGLYSDDFAFTEPVISIDHQGIVTVKIGMLELDRFTNGEYA